MSLHREGKMKIYKVRMNCVGFDDVVVRAENEEKAKEEAHRFSQCPANEMEFGEFLEVEKDDKNKVRN